MNYLKNYPGTRATPQSEPIPGTDQVENSAGGYAFEIEDLSRLRRFLILGSAGGSFYVSEKKMTDDNVKVLDACIESAPEETLKMILEVSDSGAAIKNDPAIFALARFVSSDVNQILKTKALDSIPVVCRTGTHLFTFAEIVQKHRGWGRGLKRGVANWYLDKPVDKLAYQLVKYRQREGWSHRDLLRLSHPKVPLDEPGQIIKNQALQWVTSSEMRDQIAKSAVEHPRPDTDPLFILEGFELAQRAETPADTVNLIEKYNLPREALKTEHLTEPVVWDAMLNQGMPLTALIRNLGNMTRTGVLTAQSSGTKKVVESLADGDHLHKSRVHPFTILTALATYKTGHGHRGQNFWDPVSKIVDALDGAFYAAFKNVVPSDKRFMLGLDISGSMGFSFQQSMLSCRDVSAAMSLITTATEPYCETIGFSHQLVKFPISPRQRLDDVINMISGLPFGATDCSLPVLYALENKIEIDTFVIYTDNETWYGDIHPAQALVKYREKTGIDARMVVVGMTSTGFSIADPNDQRMLDIVGFDSNAPSVISNFAAGLI